MSNIMARINVDQLVAADNYLAYDDDLLPQEGLQEAIDRFVALVPDIRDREEILRSLRGE